MTATLAPAPVKVSRPSLPAHVRYGSFTRADPALRAIGSAALRSIALAVIAGLLILVGFPAVLMAAAGL